MSKIVEVIVGYGPFPAGIIVGIWLARAAYNRALMYMEKVTIELREEKKQLMETIVAQQKRIDLLHDEAYSKKKLTRTGGAK